MTITVSLNSLGILKAVDVVMMARGDSLCSRKAEPKLVSIDVGVSTASALAVGPAGQNGIVDLIV